jgi:hypothetical protein
MRSLVLAALLYSAATLAGTEASVAQKKHELSVKAREVAQVIGRYDYMIPWMQPMPRRELQVNKFAKFASYVSLADGWSRVIEKDGVWSIGKKSSLGILLGEGELPRQLHLQGIYFNGHEPTRLFVNGQLLSEAPLNNLIVDLPSDLKNSSYMLIELYHLNPGAPRDYNPSSTDSRAIKFKIKKIRLW